MRYTLAIFFVVGSATIATADDWPQWLGPNRDGASTEVVKPWKGKLAPLWKQPAGEAHGGPVVAKGKVYLFFRTAAKNEETLATFDADTGKPGWTTSYERKPTNIAFGNGPRSAPIVSDGRIFTYGITSVLTCFNVEDGRIVWQIDCAKEFKAPGLFFGSSSSPIVVGENVLVNVGAKGASIVAFNKNTGIEAWKKLDDGASYSSPIVIGKGEIQQVIFLTSKGLVSLTPKDGSVFWQHPLVDLLSESSSTPAVVGDILIGSSITAGSIGLKLEHNREIPGVSKGWANGTLNCYFSTPVAIGKDTLYLVTGNNPLAFKKSAAILRCVDAATGKELWSREKNPVGTYHASLVRTGDGKLLLVEEPGDLVLIDANRKEYRELARSKICGNTWAHPALANGRLYIRDGKELICVELPK
ncbi:MAG: hypothetical protein EXR98_23200 [Gemmataceae bacterium]|nr:hypothetical protein [Gemmataceae bacterium]